MLSLAIATNVRLYREIRVTAARRPCLALKALMLLDCDTPSLADMCV